MVLEFDYRYKMTGCKGSTATTAVGENKSPLLIFNAMNLPNTFNSMFPKNATHQIPNADFILWHTHLHPFVSLWLVRSIEQQILT